MVKNLLRELEGITSVGQADSLAMYVRTRGGKQAANRLAITATENANTGAAGFLASAVQAVYDQSRKDRALNAKGIVGLLTDGCALAVANSLANGNTATMHQGAWYLEGLRTTNLTEFLAGALDISHRRLCRSLGFTTMRIITELREPPHHLAGSIRLQYQAASRLDPGKNYASVLEVGLHDSHDFVNLGFDEHPQVEGRGNIAAVPGALEALMEDVKLVTAGMIASSGPTRSS